MENQKEQKHECTSARKWHTLEYTILIVIAGFFLVALLVEKGVISPPMWLLQRTGDNNIYQILFSAQAALVGVVITALAILSSVISVRLFGMSMSHYIMSIRPKVLKFSVTIVGTIVLVLFSWTFLAFELVNLSAATFFAMSVLLVYLLISVTTVMHSRAAIEREIRSYILGNLNITEHTENLFQELRESVLCGDVFVAERNLDLLLEIFEAGLSDGQDDSAYKSVGLSLLRKHELYICIGKMPLEVLREEGRLERLQSAGLMYEIAQKENPLQRRRVSISSWLYEYLRTYSKEKQDALEDIYAKMLKYAQQPPRLASSSDIHNHIAESNYIGYVISLIKYGEEYLLKALFGLDRVVIKGVKPLFEQLAQGELSHTNMFIMLYVYYLGYRERESLVQEEESLFCQNLLKHISRPFLMRPVEVALFLQSQKAFPLLDEMLNIYERRHETWYGGTKSMIASDVVCDFFVFCFALLSHDISSLEHSLKSVLRDHSNAECRRIEKSSIYNRYVGQNKFVEYQKFRSIFERDGGKREKTEPEKKKMLEQIEQEYERIKIAATNLYREEKLNAAKTAGEALWASRSVYESRLEKQIKAIAKDFCSQFIDGSEEKMSFEWHDILELQTSTDLDSISKSDYYKGIILWNLNDIIFTKVDANESLTLKSATRKSATVAEFFSAVGEVEVNRLIGFDSFNWEDPDFRRYNELQQKCVQVQTQYPNVFVAVNSQVIKVGIRDVTVTISQLEQDEVERRITAGDVMQGNNVPIPIPDENTAEEYLKNSECIIKIGVEIAVESLERIVGGGFLFDETS